MLQIFVLLLVGAFLPLHLLGHTTPAASPELSKDPRAVLETAAPFYDYTDPHLKPWHLKATYQLYDEASKPAESGVYEYWWASPKVYRSSWTRGTASRTDWHTEDGAHHYLATGEPFNYFEYQFQSALLSPLPRIDELDPTKLRLSRESVSLGSSKLPCIMVIPLMPLHGQVQQVPLGLFPTYCFDPTLPVLRVRYSFGGLTIGFGKIDKMQNRYLAEEIEILEGKRKILTATVDSIAGVTPTDSAFTPDPKALVRHSGGTVHLPPGQSISSLVKKVSPIYPADAKEARVAGTVVLDATIGFDGAVHDLHVVNAPWPSLVAAALQAVSQWQYRPFTQNGEPVEVQTEINVIFQLGR